MTPGAGDATLDRARRPASAPPPRIRLPEFRRTRLRNGLTLLAVPHTDLPEVSARVVVPYGAAEDPEGAAGTALMVARALTEGTEDRSAREVAEALDYLGAAVSLEVSQDATVLSIRFLSHVFHDALDLMAEIVTRPAFAPKEVDRLKDERLDEIASGLDEPRVVASLRLAEAIFDDHPYAMREGGDEETVPAIVPEGLRAHHERFYRPEAATLILVGDIPLEDELRDRVDGAFGAWEGAAADPAPVPDPEPPEERRVRVVDWPGPQSEIRIGGVGIARNDPDYFAALVANAILGGLFSSRINLNLREDKGWTYGAHSRFHARKRRGPYYISTAVDAAATGAAVGEILGEVERMRSDPPSEEELELARNALTLSLPRMFETAVQVSKRVAEQVIYGLEDEYWERYRDRVQGIDESAVASLAQRCLDVERSAVVVVGPLEEIRSELEGVGTVEVQDRWGRPGG